MLELKSEQSSCHARLTLWSTAGFITHPAASHHGAIKMFRASVFPFSCLELQWNCLKSLLWTITWMVKDILLERQLQKVETLLRRSNGWVVELKICLKEEWREKWTLLNSGNVHWQARDSHIIDRKHWYSGLELYVNFYYIFVMCSVDAPLIEWV